MRLCFPTARGEDQPMAHSSLTRHERLSSSRTNSGAEDATWQPFTVCILMNAYMPRFLIGYYAKSRKLSASHT